MRGTGLMIGIEVVDNKASKKPAPNVASHIKEAMVARRVLLATDGPHANVIKIKPPMVFAEAEADHLIAELTQASSVLVLWGACYQLPVVRHCATSRNVPEDKRSEDRKSLYSGSFSAQNLSAHVLAMLQLMPCHGDLPPYRCV